MDNFISQLCVLVLLLVVALGFMLLLRNGDSDIGKVVKKLKTKIQGNGGTTAEPKTGHGATRIMPKLYLYQLDPKTGKAVQEYVIRQIPECGLGVSRPDASEGDIFLSDVCEEAFYVGTNHILIGEDEEGVFVKDNHSKNHVYIKGNPKPVDVVDIKNGTILYLGMQPVQFIFPDQFPMDWDEKPRATKILDASASSAGQTQILRRR